jgi:hypothetical protein
MATEMAGLGVPLTATTRPSSWAPSNTVVGSIKNVTIKPIIANLWSSGDTHVAAGSTVMRSVNKLEVALVLDNTGSMASTLNSGDQEDRRPDQRLQVAGRHPGRRRGPGQRGPTR